MDNRDALIFALLIGSVGLYLGGAAFGARAEGEAVLAGAIFAFPDKCPDNKRWAEFKNANGRVLIGSGGVTDVDGNSFSSKPGDTRGLVAVTLTRDQMPNHEHKASLSHTGNFVAQTSGAAPVNYDGGQLGWMKVSVDVGGVWGHTKPIGSAAPTSVMQPSVTVVFCQLLRG